MTEAKVIRCDIDEFAKQILEEVSGHIQRAEKCGEPTYFVLSLDLAKNFASSMGGRASSSPSSPALMAMIDKVIAERLQSGGGN